MSALSAFFEPRSIVFVGASNDPSRIGGRPLAYCLRDGFAGAVHAVNPGRETVQGVGAHPDIPSIDAHEIDLAILAIPARDVPAALRDAAVKHVRAAVILSSGFAEIGEEGAALQAEALGIARGSAMRLVGPNSLGLISNGNGVCATFSSVIETAAMRNGPLAIVSQSGAYGAHLAMLALDRGIGISRFATTGNEADVTIADLIDHMADDPQVGVIGCYSEGIADGRSFLAAVERARVAGKPVVMMKVGRSAEGSKAAQSHTASLAGDDAVFDAVARDAGVARVATTAEFVDLLYTLSRRAPVPGNRLGIVTVSGGAGVLMADAASDHGFNLPPMPEAAQARLKTAIPFGSAVNPVDTTAQAMNDLSLVGQAITAMLDDAGYDAVAGFFMNWPDSPALGPQLRAAITAAIAGRDDRTIAVAMNAGAETVRSFDEAGLLVFDDPSHAIAALGGSRRLGEAMRKPPIAMQWDVAGGLPLPARIDEHMAGRLLSAAGVPMAELILAETPDAVGAAIDAMREPAVLKILSPDIQHKSDIGGVALDVVDGKAGREIATSMLDRCRQTHPTADLRGFLVGPMARGEVELLLGGRIDPVFGPVVVCGLGGVFVEIFKDVAIAAAPIGQAHAEAMLRSLKAWPLMDGARGKPRADVASAAEAIAAFSRFVAAHADEIASVEVNPLLVRADGQGVLGLDAVIERRPSDPSDTGADHA